MLESLPIGHLSTRMSMPRKRKNRNSLAADMKNRAVCPDYMASDKWCKGRCNLYHPKGSDYVYFAFLTEMEEEAAEAVRKRKKNENTES